MASRPDVRIGNAERDGAADELGEHFRAGRLDMHEYEERITAAYAAKTSAELGGLFQDLPRSGPAPRQDSRGAQGDRSFGMLVLRGVALAILGAMAIGLIIGGLPFLLVGFLIWARLSGRCYGPRYYHSHARYRAGAWG